MLLLNGLNCAANGLQNRTIDEMTRVDFFAFAHDLKKLFFIITMYIIYRIYTHTYICTREYAHASVCKHVFLTELLYRSRPNDNDKNKINKKNRTKR